MYCLPTPQNAQKVSLCVSGTGQIYHSNIPLLEDKTHGLTESNYINKNIVQVAMNVSKIKIFFSNFGFWGHFLQILVHIHMWVCMLIYTHIHPNKQDPTYPISFYTCYTEWVTKLSNYICIYIILMQNGGSIKNQHLALFWGMRYYCSTNGGWGLSEGSRFIPVPFGSFLSSGKSWGLGSSFAITLRMLTTEEINNI